MTTTATLTIRLPKDMKDALTAICRDSDITPSQLIRHMLREQLGPAAAPAKPKPHSRPRNQRKRGA